MTNITMNPERSPAGMLDSGYKSANYRVLNGSGFGVKSGYTYANDFESWALGNVNAGAYNGLTVSIGGGITVDNTKSFSGTKSLKKDYYNNNDFPKIYLPYPTDSQHAYFSCKFYFETHDLDGVAAYSPATSYVINDVVQTGGMRYKNIQACTGVNPATDYTHVYWVAQGNVWKFGRFGNRQNDPYNNNRFTHEYTGTLPQIFSGDLASDEHGNTEKYAAVNEVSASAAPMTAGVWHHVTMRARAGTVEGNDAFFEIRIDGTPICRYTGGNFRTTSRTNQIYGVLTPICGLDCQWNGTPKSNTQMWMDEVFTTCSDRFLEMTDSSNYSLSTKFATLEDFQGGWTDTKIVYKPKVSNFTVGSTAYIHVIVNGVSIFNSPVVV